MEGGRWSVRRRWRFAACCTVRRRGRLRSRKFCDRHSRGRVRSPTKIFSPPPGGGVFPSFFFFFPPPGGRPPFPRPPSKKNSPPVQNLPAAQVEDVYRQHVIFIVVTKHVLIIAFSGGNFS